MGMTGSPRGPATVLTGLSALCMVVWLGACTRIVIQDPGDAVRVTDHFGFAAITFAEAEQPVLLDADGTGLITVSGQVVLGHHRINAAILPVEDCRIVVWLTSPEDAAALRQLIGDPGSICTIGAPPR